MLVWKGKIKLHLNQSFRVKLKIFKIITLLGLSQKFENNKTCHSGEIQNPLFMRFYGI